MDTDRLTPSRELRIDRIDLMLACALVVIVSSYTLGYRLDWSQLDTKPSEGAAPEEVSSAPEIAPSPAPTQIVPEPPKTAWAPDPKEEAWDQMTGELSDLAQRYRGRVAIYLKDLKTNKTWSYRPEDLFASASLIKVPVMVCVFEKIHDGDLSLYERLTLRRHNRVGGSGSLKWRPDGARLTVRELLQLMISESDNTATNMLLERLGLGYAQREFPKIGLFSTGIFEEGMSIRGGRVAHENYTTAREMNMLMEKIYRGGMIDRPSSQLMMEILKHKKAVASRLAKGLPAGWEIAHKTGLLRHACHDTAIFLTPNGDYALTVLTGANANYKKAKDFISRLGWITFVHYGGTPRARYYVRLMKRRNQIVRL